VEEFMNILEHTPEEIEEIAEKSMEELRENLRRLDGAFRVTQEMLQQEVTI